MIMRVTLDYTEIKAALAEALEQKTQHVHGNIDADDCYFGGDVESGDYTNLEFSAEV